MNREVLWLIRMEKISHGIVHRARVGRLESKSMKMLEIEKIAAMKFIEIKGTEYLDSNKYNMAKSVSNSKDGKEVKFVFMIAKARPKLSGVITVDESIPWDEEVAIVVDIETGECRVE